MLNLESSISTAFKAQRSITLYGPYYEDEEKESTIASVELTGSGILCVLDKSEYCFTAQQCGELADKLSMLIQAYTVRKGDSEDHGSKMKLDLSKIFYSMILQRSPSTQRDFLELCDDESDALSFGASGEFYYTNLNAGGSDYYQLFVGIDDELCIPCFGIEDRVFRLGFDDAIWLIEQLCVGGYLLAQVECAKANSMAVIIS